MNRKIISIFVSTLLIATILPMIGLAGDNNDNDTNQVINLADSDHQNIQIDTFGGKGLGWNYLHTGTSHETSGIDDNSFCVSTSYLPADLRLGMTIDLSSDIGYYITKVAYHDTDGYSYTDGTNCIAEVWEGDYSQPITKVANETFVSSGDGWHDINLTNPVEITGTGIYWLIFGFYQDTSMASWFLFSCDDICSSPGCAWFSSDGGTTWTDIPGAGYCYTMNFEAYVEEGGPQPQDVMITALETGWNLVSLPFNTSVDKINITVNYLGTNYTWADAVTAGYVNQFVFGWDRIGQSYVFSDIFIPGDGYWVYSVVDCELWKENITIIPDVLITGLKTGWNLMGVPSVLNVNKTDLICGYGGSDYNWADAVTAGYVNQFVFGWDRIGQSYVFSDIFIPGDGYWMYTTVDCLLKQ